MQSFDAMFRAYFARVYRFARSLTRDESAAEELTQQTFYQALKGIDGFRGQSDPATWLCGIAKRVYFNVSAREKRTHAHLPGDETADGRARVGEALEDREQAMRIHRALHALDEPRREVFSLRVFGELSYEQIAGLFGKTPGWARVTFFRAKCEILEKIREEENHE